MKKTKPAPEPDDFWDSQNVKTPKVLRPKIEELKRRAGCRRFADYVRHLIRLEIAKAGL